jgi:FtsP/CotA-like multicopper oxidase with cupredoxin domain
MSAMNGRHSSFAAASLFLLLSAAPGCSIETGSRAPDTTPSPAAVVDPAPLPAAAPPTRAPRYGLTTLEDINPDPKIVEVNLVAEHTHHWDMGKNLVVHGVAYNGSNPGPILEANLGDRIIVHFENKLAWETTVHWHGLRVPAAMDGAAHHSQPPIPPGGKFDYEFVARDVGMYWYHPHHQEGAQIDLGLYGAILIHAPNEPTLSLDQPLVLDDVLIQDGKIAGYDPHSPEPPRDTFDEDGDGVPTDRFGNTLLANGRQDFVAPVRAGTWALFRLVNAASARYLRIALQGHTMRVVGVDGGFLAEPFDTDSLRIGIGERYLVLVKMTGTPGQRYAFINTREPEDPFAYDPIDRKPMEIAAVQYASDAPITEAMPLFPADDVPSFMKTDRVDYTWVLNTIVVDGNPMNAINGAIAPNIPTPTFARDGDYTFVVKNDDSGAHPFHLHGNRFQVLEVDGKPSPLRGWKDTVDMKAGSTVVLRTHLDNPGHWMVHCHILRHIEEGMMGMIMVQ